MKLLFCALTLCFLSAFSCLGTERIEWIDSVYNLGLIREDDGIKEGEFKFVNLGSKPVLIQRIKTSCGCTNVVFPQDFISSGDTATIRFQFNPARRPGKVDKNIKVYFDNIDEVYTLTFVGTVIGAEQTLSLKYPFKHGDIRLERLSVKTDTLIKGMKRHLFLEIYNQGVDSIFSEGDNLVSVPNMGIETKVVPDKVAPGESATLMIEIDSSKINGFGKKTFHPVLKWVTNKNDSVGLDISTIILPDTSEKSNSPKGLIKLVNNIVEIDNITNDPVALFELENIGDGPLKLYGILAEEEGMIEASWPEEIAEGKKGVVKIYLLPDKISNGVFRINFDIISDDRYFPLSSCKIVGIK